MKFQNIAQAPNNPRFLNNLIRLEIETRYTRKPVTT